VKIQVEVLWAVTPCNIVVGYQRFEGPCCLLLQWTGIRFKFEPVATLVSQMIYFGIWGLLRWWRRRKQVLPKRLRPTATLHVVTIQKTSIWMSEW